MKRLAAAFAAAGFAACALAAPVKVDRIDPPHWWAGMHNPSLQLQVYGPGIKNAQVSLADYPGVKLDSVARLDGSDNYLFLYLDVTPEAKPGNLSLTFTEGKKSKKVGYKLLQRKPQRGAQGFDSSDVLYMIMPDRFADGNPGNNIDPSMHYPVGADRSDINLRQGGDLKGIADHVGYLDSLGVTAIWLNPVLENDMPRGSYHGYATTDYYKVDPRFGSNAEYAALIDTLHNHGMKTVMDMIFNHSGSGHVWFTDRPSHDWFNFPDTVIVTSHKLGSLMDPYGADYDRVRTTDGCFVPEMPDLNQRNPHLMKYLIQNSIWWIEEAGIDGIRMDTYPYADKYAMNRWVKDVLAEYPSFNIVGECWFDAPGREAYWQKGHENADGFESELPTVMDFPLMILSREAKVYNEETGDWDGGFHKVYGHLGLDFIYPDPSKVLRFLDNHDTERFITSMPENLDGWKQAVTLLLTIPGIPQLYYGTELLMNGTRQGGDGNVRLPMPGGFPGDEGNKFIRSGRDDMQNEAFDYLAALLKWRRGSKAVADGTMKHFSPNGPLYLYQRLDPASGEEVVVMMYGSDKPGEADMSRYAEVIRPGDRFRDVVTGEEVVIEPKMSFPGRTVRVLQRNKK